MSLTEELDKPKRRLVLCMGVHCNAGNRAEPLYECLTKLLGERGPAWATTGPIRWEIANCLDMCDDGPNLLVYPDADWHDHLNVSTLEAIVRALLTEST